MKPVEIEVPMTMPDILDRLEMHQKAGPDLNTGELLQVVYRVQALGAAEIPVVDRLLKEMGRENKKVVGLAVVDILEGKHQAQDVIGMKRDIRALNMLGLDGEPEVRHLITVLDNEHHFNTVTAMISYDEAKAVFSRIHQSPLENPQQVDQAITDFGELLRSGGKTYGVFALYFSNPLADQREEMLQRRGILSDRIGERHLALDEKRKTGELTSLEQLELGNIVLAEDFLNRHPVVDPDVPASTTPKSDAKAFLTQFPGALKPPLAESSTPVVEPTPPAQPPRRTDAQVFLDKFPVVGRPVLAEPTPEQKAQEFMDQLTEQVKKLNAMIFTKEKGEDVDEAAMSELNNNIASMLVKQDSDTVQPSIRYLYSRVASLTCNTILDNMRRLVEGGEDSYGPFLKLYEAYVRLREGEILGSRAANPHDSIPAIPIEDVPEHLRPKNSDTTP